MTLPLEPIQKIYNKHIKDIDVSSYKNRILTITDPPYNQGYRYNEYKDRLNEKDYMELLSYINTPCVIIHYPEETINLLPKVFDVKCEQVVSWVYNSNTGKQHRLISWWGCKPDFRKVRQPYKNLKDKRIQERILNGHVGSKLYDWWEINQVKNVSREKTEHPCQIPESLIERIIKITAEKDDIIFDPFLGSGTTCKVANDMGYGFIGCEVDEKYHKISINRIFNNKINLKK